MRVILLSHTFCRVIKVTKLIIILMMVANIATGQAAIARLKYEEAEEAYTGNNFELTLSKLAEVEALLKQTNPKIMYLQILATSRIIEKDLENNIALVDKARKLSARYLTDYENVPDNDEKFRDIYKISEKMKTLPANKEELEKLLAEKAEKKHKEQADIDSRFMNYNYFKNVPGQSMEDTKAAYPDYFKKSRIDRTEDGDFLITEDYALLTPKRTFFGFFIKNNKAYGYMGRIVMDAYGKESASDCEGTKEIQNIVNNMSALFNMSPTKTVKDISRKDWPGKTTSYTWEKNNKKIRIDYLDQYNKNRYYSGIYIYSFDENLAK